MRNRNSSASSPRKAHAEKELPAPNAGFQIDPPTTANLPVKVEIVIRVWAPAQHEHESNPHEYNRLHHPGVLALIEDVIAPKRGVLVANEDRLHISGLEQPADALLVSRQIQTCMQGFRRHHGAATVALSIAMDARVQGKPTSPPGADAGTVADHSSSEPSYDLVTLLKLSKPAQILATHDLCQRIHDMKGLPLKSFPARFGVFEYLWTAEDKLELLQSEPQLTLAALPATPHPERAPKSAVPSTPAAPISSRAATLPEEPSSPEDQDKATLLGLPRSVFIPAVAVLAVAIIAFLGIRAVYHSPAASPIAQTASQPSGTRTSTPETSTTSASQTPGSQPSASQSPASATPTGTAPTPSSSTSPTSSNNAPAVPTTSKPAATAPAHKASARDKHDSSTSAACNLSDDPSRLIRLAQQYRSRGDYKNAVRIFRQVLACEPNDAAAREGLARAEAGEAESRQ